MPSEPTRVVRAKCERWGELGAVGFIEVKDVHDGTVSLTVRDKKMSEVASSWLRPKEAWRIGWALMVAANEIERRWPEDPEASDA